MLMSLKDFTARLAPLSRETPATLNRQLRFWTEIGSIPVANRVSVGMGRARFYGKEALLVAAVAIELSHWNIAIGTLKSVLGTVQEHLRLNAPPMDGAVDGSKQVTLVVHLGDMPGRLHGLVVEAHEASHYADSSSMAPHIKSVLILNLTRLWSEFR
jgi:hypothetical protein